MPFKEFINLLRDEYDQYSLLKEKAGLKQKTIIDNDIDKLAAFVGEEQEIISVIDDLEEERNKFLAKIGEEKGITVEDISFHYLAKLLPEEEKEGFRKLKEDFLALLTELQEINERNRQLIEDSMQINDFSLQLIRQAAGKGLTYSKPGKKEDESTHIIDRKA